jgi:hypothetical protein
MRFVRKINFCNVVIFNILNKGENTSFLTAEQRAKVEQIVSNRTRRTGRASDWQLRRDTRKICNVVSEACVTNSQGSQSLISFSQVTLQSCLSEINPNQRLARLNRPNPAAFPKWERPSRDYENAAGQLLQTRSVTCARDRREFLNRQKIWRG